MRELYFVTAICIIAFGCQPSPPARTLATIQLADDDSATRSEILKHAPVGSSVEDAQKLLEENGFEISHRADDEGPYLYFDLQKSVDAFVSRRWRVIVRYDDSAITGVSVSSGLFGL